MAKNEQLFRVLKDLRPDNDTRDLQISALEALMNAPLDQPNTFREAVIKHQAVLTHEDYPDLYTDASAESENFLNSRLLLTLQQKAAQKRFEFGLNSLELKDLCDLLKAGTRIATLVAFENKTGLKEGYNWEKNLSHLTDQVFANIMQAEIGRQVAAKVQAAHKAIQAIIEPIDLATPDKRGVINLNLKLLREISEVLQTQKDFLSTKITAYKPEPFDVISSTNVKLSALIFDAAMNAVSTISNLLRPVDITTASLDQLQQNITNCESNAQEAEEFFATAKIAATTSEQLDEITRLKAEIQIKLATLKAQKQAKLIEETTTQLKAKMEELFAHTGAENEKSQLLGEINALKRAVDKEQDLAGQIAIENKNLLERYQQPATAFKTVIAAISAITASANEATDMSNTLITAPKEPAHYGNTFNLRSGGVLSQYFSRSVVLRGRTAPAPDVVDVNVLTTRVVPASGAAPNLAPIYERKKLEQGDTIHSTAVLPAEGQNVRQGQTVTCKLVKDVTGMVVDKSTGQLSPGQRILSALEHAQLAIQDWTPREGDAIVISGSAANSDQANRVLAALLLLKAGNPALSNMKIKSEVPGCAVPEGTPSMMWMGGESEETAIQNFIEKWIPTSEFSLDKKEQLKRQVAQFTAFKQNNRDQFFTLSRTLAAAPASAEVLKQRVTQMRNLALQENETVNVETRERSPVTGV